MIIMIIMITIISMNYDVHSYDYDDDCYDSHYYYCYYYYYYRVFYDYNDYYAVLITIIMILSFLGHGYLFSYCYCPFLPLLLSLFTTTRILLRIIRSIAVRSQRYDKTVSKELFLSPF